MQMDRIRRLLGNGSGMETLQIRFPNDHSRPAVRVTGSVDYPALIHALDLPCPSPTIFISGGADKMELESATSMRSTLEDGLARFLEAHQISLIDGGTFSGVMALIGFARQRRNYSFPLVGVTPEKQVSFPDDAHPQKPTNLDPGHSHFVLTDGDQFGSESEVIINLAYALSGAGEMRRLGIIINGGEIVKREAYWCSTREPRFPLLVLEGSGRFADELAQSRTTGSSDPMIRAILDQGIVHFTSLKAGSENLYRWLENFFGDGEGAA